MFKTLFSPLKVGKLTLKNRFVMPAIHLGYADAQGKVTPRHLAFYRERARGGVALIIVGGAYPEERGKGYPSMLGIARKEHLPGLKELAATIKENGCHAGIQLLHVGRYGSSRFLGEPPVSASAIPSKLTREVPRELSTAEVEETIKNYGRAAALAQEAGFDVVEVIASAGYLVSQFLSPLTNKRTDKYGGSPENRLNFLREIIAAIKEMAPKVTLSVRLSGDEFMEGGLTHLEVRKIAKAIFEAGVEMINVTGGWHETEVPQITMHVPRGAYLYLAKGIKEEVGVPVVASNRLNDPWLAEKVVSEGWADLVAVGRALIADPEFPRKVQEGRLEEIAPCVGCNQGCLDRIFSGEAVSCLVNARAGREASLLPLPAARKKKVLVIGAGPAGLEAASVARARGHEVTVVEKGTQAGGQLLLAAAPPAKSDFSKLVRYLEGRARRTGVNFLFNTEADAALVNSLKPEAVVVATGARPIVPNWAKGKPNVVTAWEVLAGKARPGKRVAVVGGGAVGCETALFLTFNPVFTPEIALFLLNYGALRPAALEEEMYRARRVSLVEMLARVGSDIGPSTRWITLKELARHGVEVHTETEVVAVVPEGIRVRKKEGEVVTLEADTVVVAVGAAPTGEEVAAEIRALVPEVYVIGDAKKPRKAIDAIFEGLEVGIRL